MSNLKSTIEVLANEFALSIVSALRSASIDELTGGFGAGPRAARPGRPAIAEVGGRKRGRGGRLGRRSAADIDQMIESIVSVLQQNPEGLRAEQIREALSCQAKELPRPLADALSSGRISKTGQKRATTYFAGGTGEAGAAPAGAKRKGGRGRRKRA
ncbi:MAG TPA: hypothetical protein VM580_28035 [Labilithrix sp.]|nr:hypothetical protein [Labilithrix sp.]